MSDETQSAGTSSPLFSRVNAAPFVPSSRGELLPRSGSSTNVNAKPFVPGAGRAANQAGSLGAEAKPFVPSTNGDAARSSGVNAPVFVPGANSGIGTTRAPAAMSTSAPAFVPRGPSEGTIGRGGAGFAQRAEPRLPEGDDFLGMTAHNPLAGDNRSTAANVLPDPMFVAGTRPGSAAFSGGFPGRNNGRGKGPTPAPPAFSPAAARGAGRGPAGRAFDGSGRGRGRGRAATPGQAPLYPGHPGYHAGLSTLTRAHQTASTFAEQLVPRLQAQAYMTNAQVTPEMQAEVGVPDMVQHFHSLYPLEDLHVAEEGVSRALGVQSSVLKAISAQDGQAYALRKLSWRQMHPVPELLAHASEVVDAWAGLGLHPQLSVPRSTLVSADYDGHPGLFIAHDYYAAAATLEAAHLQPQVTANGLVQVGIGEDTLWSYLVQLAAALRAVHSVGLACRAALHPSKVLLVAGTRIRLGSLGVAEIVAGQAARQDDVGALQREDLVALGRLLLQLACCMPQHPSLEYCAAHFSPELTHILASLLLQHQEPILSWRQLTAALREQAFGELDAQHIYCDAVMGQLARETENGRLLRLLVRLSMVTERADMDPQWAETGDRYLLKLFRDFVFHQCTEEGAPVLDWGHVVEALNKLDAGVPEKVMLMSRDESSMLVVSYADIKRCIENTFSDLRRQATVARPSPQPVDRPRTPL